MRVTTPELTYIRVHVWDGCLLAGRDRRSLRSIEVIGRGTRIRLADRRLGPVHSANFKAEWQRHSKRPNSKRLHENADRTHLWRVSCFDFYASKRGFGISMFFQTAGMLLASNMSLSQDEESFTKFFENAPDPMIVLDSDLQFADANRAACTLMALPKDRLIGTSIEAVMESGFEVDSCRNQLESGVNKRYRRWLLRGDGTRRLVEASIAANAVPGRHFVICRDVTEGYLMEKEAIEVEKNDSLARLAAGFSHDFTNLLNVIGGHTELLIREIGPDNRVQGHTDSILAAVKQAAVLSSQLSQFEGQRPLSPELLDITSITLGLRETLKSIAGSSVRLELPPCKASLPKIKADRVQLGQVLLTLTGNAREAIIEKGTISIETSHVHLERDLHDEQCRVPAGEYVLLTVRALTAGKNGAACKSFNKLSGKRLKLPLVHGSLLAASARLVIDESTAGEVAYRIYFRADAATTGFDTAADSSEDLSGTETILLVDDEIGLRETAIEYLKCLGYKLLRAGNGEEALAVARSAPKIDALVTDLRMPNLSGEDLAAQLMKERPEIKILFATAAADSDFARQQVAKGNVRLLLKPFVMRDLARVLRHFLNERARVAN